MNEEPNLIEEWCTVSIDHHYTEQINSLYHMYKELEKSMSHVREMTLEVRQIQDEMKKAQEEMKDSIKTQTDMIEEISDHIQALRNEFNVYHSTSSHKDRTIELLEELRVLKQRELNLMIREKIPCPFLPAINAYGEKKKAGIL